MSARLGGAKPIRRGQARGRSARGARGRGGRGEDSHKMKRQDNNTRSSSPAATTSEETSALGVTMVAVDEGSGITQATETQEQEDRQVGSCHVHSKYTATESSCSFLA